MSYRSCLFADIIEWGIGWSCLNLKYKTRHLQQDKGVQKYGWTWCSNGWIKGSFNYWMDGNLEAWSSTPQLIDSNRPMLFCMLKTRMLELSCPAGSFEEWNYTSFPCVSDVLEALEDSCFIFRHFHCLDLIHMHNRNKKSSCPLLAIYMFPVV